MQYNILIQGKDFSDCPIAQALVKIPYWVTQKLPQIYTANGIAMVRQNIVYLFAMIKK